MTAQSFQKTLLLLALMQVWLVKVSARQTVPDSVSTTDSTTAMNSDAYANYIDSIIRCYHEELIQYDSLIQLSELETSDSIPIFDSEVYASRLEELNAKTPFDLSYNTRVEAFIHLYVTKKRSLSSNSISRSFFYFPTFEEALDRHGLPMELKYLAVVESGLNPTARSKAGATGLWQFMYRTGKKFGLTINSYVDDRCDPYKSTEAACAYLKYLHNLFGDWNLALAAYNCGEGRVSKAIRRSGGKRSYWDLYPYLPRETRGYVPAFIAVNYLFAHHKEHLIHPTSAPFFPHEIDSVYVNHPVSFEQVSKVVDVDIETLEALNPTYRINVVPAYDREHSVVYMPKEKVRLWVDNETKVEAQLHEMVKNEPIATPKQERYYYVRSGDYLGKIAANNGCTVRQIQEWNGLRSTRLSVGQKLMLYGDAPITPKKTSAPNTYNSRGYRYYTVRSGDTLWDISKAQGVSLEKLKALNTGVDFRKMKPGQKLVIKSL